MRVTIHLFSQSQPIEHLEVINTYQKGDLFCVKVKDKVFKYVLSHIFRITEEG